MKSLLLFFVLFSFVGSAAASTFYGNGRTETKTSGSHTLVEARVAELDFTARWFRNQSQPLTLQGHAPCPLPSSMDDLAFGLGYDSVQQEAESASCWIRELHKSAGNVNLPYLEDRQAALVHGAGVSELLVATILSVAVQFPQKDRQPIVTAHATPYYAVMKQVTKSPVLQHVVQWVEPSEVMAGKHAGRPLIVVAIVPGNPIGNIEPGLLAGCRTESDSSLACFGSPTKFISDHSYLWPCLMTNRAETSSNETEWDWTLPVTPKSSSALLFGLSKLSGHAGIRHGWAWITDCRLASSVRRTLWELGTSLSAAAVVQSTRVIAAIVSGENFHSWCQQEMDLRWSKLHAQLSGNNTSFRILSERRSPTALIQCPAGSDCAELLYRAGILATSGVEFGSSRNTARISLGRDESQFQEMLAKFASLVSFGTGRSTSMTSYR